MCRCVSRSNKKKREEQHTTASCPENDRLLRICITEEKASEKWSASKAEREKRDKRVRESERPHWLQDHLECFLSANNTEGKILVIVWCDWVWGSEEEERKWREIKEITRVNYFVVNSSSTSSKETNATSLKKKHLCGNASCLFCMAFPFNQNFLRFLIFCKF